MASSASRGLFTGVAATAAKSSTRVAGTVAGRGSATGHVGRLTFQELQHARRAFSTSNMLRSNNSNNALTRFAGNFSADSPNKVVYSILAINVAVFGVWQYAEGNAKRFHDGRLYMFMYRNFTDSLQNLKEGRQHKPPSNSIHYSMGASGSIMGITTAFACVYPMSQYSLFFVITMPAAALIGLFGAYELYNVLAANTGRFDSAGHLGGGLYGAAYYFTRLRPYIRR
ncbi:hypothetical protein EC991_010050 [Linnemannia zychae]|nr:hypothetical protein EC991_010050 [Linnemannia zychae]